MRLQIIILIVFLLVPTILFAKEVWKPLSPETVLVQSEQEWKATKIAKNVYDQLVIQKKVDLSVKEKTFFSFRYQIHTNREILYLQVTLIPLKGEPYFVILHRPTPDEWHTVTLSRNDFRTFNYTIPNSDMKIKTIELNLHTRQNKYFDPDLAESSKNLSLKGYQSSTKVESKNIIPKSDEIVIIEFSEIQIDKTIKEVARLESFFWPKNGELVTANPPFFNWQKIPGIDSYTIQYSQDSLFFSGTVYSYHISQNYFTPDALLDTGRWYARLEYRSNKKLEYSSVISFLVTKHSRAFIPPHLPERINQSHPYLYITPDIMTTYRNEKSGVKKELWLTIDNYVRTISYCFVPEEPEQYPNGIWNYEYWRNMVDKSGAAQNHIILSAFHYLLSEDTVSAENAKRIMLEVSKWDIDGSTAVRSCDHAAQALLYSLSIGYDWLYDYLTPEERQLIRNCIVSRAEQMAAHLNPMQADPTNNHPWFNASALGIAGLAVYNELAEAKDWVEYTKQLYCGVFLCLGGQDGDWHEGIDYWSYTLFFVFQWLDCLRSATGLDLYAYPWLQHTARYKIVTHPPQSLGVPFGDSKSRPPNEFDALIMLRLASRYQDNLAQWYAKEIIRSPIRTWHVYFYLWDDPSLPSFAPINLPNTSVYRDSGIVVYHSDMTNPDETMLAFKSGPYFGRRAGHAHPDQNSFVFYGYGDPLLIDSGYYDTGKGNYYGSPHHRGWTVQTKAHNTILVDGYGQAIYTPGADGSITQFLNLGTMAYFAGDASSPEIYSSRLTHFVRYIIALDNRLFFIYDNVASSQPVRYDWLLHSSYPFSIEKEEKRVKIIGKKAKLSLQFLNPESLSYTLSSGFYPLAERPKPTDFPDQYHFSAYPRLDAKIDWVNASTFGNPEQYTNQPCIKKEAMTWLAAIYLTPLGDTTELNIMPISTSNWLGGTIQLPEQYYHYLLSRDSGINKLEYRGYSFTGKGAVIGLSTTGKVNRLFLLEGREVKMLGMSMFNSTTPVTILGEIEKNHANLQLAVTKDATIDLIPLGEPKEIYINGILQASGSNLWKYNSATGKIQLFLPAGTHTIAVTYLADEFDSFKLNSDK
ncbi:MAG: DUF4962 domain-containing protein [bacterium]|nr:DUF4962 domain-containing protein [bacterium]